MKIPFPKGATHVRIETTEGKTSTVVKEDADDALLGVAGTLTFLVKNTGTVKKEKGEFTAFAGAIPNPIADGKKDEKAESKPAEADAKSEPATPKAKAKSKAAKVESAPMRDGKTKFIADLITGGKPEAGKHGKHVGEYSAREIAAKVVHKFPEEKMNAEDQLAKALRFVRAVPWHLNRRGITAIYAPEKKAKA